MSEAALSGFLPIDFRWKIPVQSLEDTVLESLQIRLENLQFDLLDLMDNLMIEHDHQ